MPKLATKLAPAARGGFTARKVIPRDVAPEYARLYGQRTEERLSTGAVPIVLARAKHREWSSEIEARISNIRAGRKGDGRTLTPTEARALAGEWHAWFIARESDRLSADAWEDHWHRMREEVEAAAINCGVFAGQPLDLVQDNPAIRERMRPVVADEAKSEQFLAAKRMVLDASARMMFLDYLTRDFFAAISLLARRARGDYGADKYAERFPRAQGLTDASLTPWILFERWIEKAKPAASTVDRWRSVFLKLAADFPTTSAGALLPEQMQEWANGLITEERTAFTVSEVWVRASRTVFAWALGEKLIPRNPFVGWRITVPKKRSTRETKAFQTKEANTILAAALAVQGRGRIAAAKRWCPWIAAYNGARMGELTQLRDTDVIEQDGISALRISPEAGTTKTGTTRIVPIHEHLIEQGFLEFVKASGQGPLFYNVGSKTKAAAKADPTNPKKARSVKTRERIGAWVRGLGVDDPELSPNHAWRHTFKAIADRSGIPEKITDAICGHAPATTGRGYGAPTIADKARELQKFPRYDTARPPAS